MKSTMAKFALALAVAAPLTLVVADDEKKAVEPKVTVRVEAQTVDGANDQDDKKVEKRVEVKVLRLDGNEAREPQVRVLRLDGNEAGKPHLKVITREGKTELKVFVAGADEKAIEKHTYLGVAVEPVPAALAAHLPGMLTKDQGVLVTNVAADSPAGKAGLKEHDVLLSFDDQKLFSADQLTKLVRGEKAGREVTLTIVRGGKAEKVKATLAEREMPRGVHALMRLGVPHGQIIELKDLHEAPAGKGVLRGEILKTLEKLEDRAAPGKVGTKVQSSFSSMTIKSLDGDRFHAEIEFKNDKGDTLKRSFDGTRDEIKKEIEADKEMPDAIRQQLLRSLDVGGSGRGKGGFGFQVQPGAFRFDADGADVFKSFNLPAFENIVQIIEQISGDVDPEVREQLRKAFRSIEEPKDNPAPRDRSL